MQMTADEQHRADVWRGAHLLLPSRSRYGAFPGHAKIT